MDRAEFYLFVLLALLIAAAYYVGVSTDARAVAGGINSIILSSTGRDASGAFAGYPPQRAA